MCLYSEQVDEVIVVKIIWREQKCNFNLDQFSDLLHHCIAKGAVPAHCEVLTAGQEWVGWH